ncbi:helix-turn-helix domain-containing protein [Pedobacter sp. UC225_65]|uniref:helix-turn-helix domain-containing protein n=1 Tax=Pedobacter sp. UC225_65 TaxID=3350173 RepID=UPI00366C8FF2
MARLDLMTREDLEQFKAEMLEEIGVMLKVKNVGTTQQQWMRSADVRRMLKISPGTLQNLRVNGTLSYTKVGGTMFYRISDIEKMLSKGTV